LTVNLCVPLNNEFEFNFDAASPLTRTKKKN